MNNLALLRLYNEMVYTKDMSNKKSVLEFKPKFDKILELLVYLSFTKPGADHYQAVKFFYLADKEHLNRYGRPITYEKYCALPYGPVASNVLDLLRGNK